MYNTSVLLDNLQAQTEQLLQKVMNEWQRMPVSSLNEKPSAQAWSAAQCLAHLNVYSCYYLPALEKAITEAEQKGLKPADDYTSGWLGNYFYQQMLPTTEGVKMKMKAPANATPVEQPNAKLMIAEFIDHQQKTLQLIERARHINIAQVRVPITIAKWIKLKVGDTFLFMIAHNQRHILQGERALLLK